ALFLLQRFIWLYAFTKFCRVSLSFTASPEKTRFLLSGPRMPRMAFWSPFLAAVNRASPAAAGEANVFCTIFAPEDSAAFVSRLLQETREQMTSSTAATEARINRECTVTVLR